MIITATEEKAVKLFDAYENCAAFKITGSSKGYSNKETGVEVSYANIGILPDADTINAVVNGDMKAGKVISKAVKEFTKPWKDPSKALMMGTIINMATSDRKKSPVVIILIIDKEDPATKFLVNYLSEIFAIFGLSINKKKGDKIVKRLVEDLPKKTKKRKIKMIKRILKLEKDKGNHLSNAGIDAKKMISVFTEIEMRAAGITNLGENAIKGDTYKALLKSLVGTYTGTNIKNLGDRMKLAEKLAELDKEAVESYKAFKHIIVDNAEIFGINKMPKVKYGYKKSKKKTSDRKPKMKVKKFAKFFGEKNNRGLAIMLIAHTAADRQGWKPGDKEYSKFVGAIAKEFATADFWKAYEKAAIEYYKTKG